MIPAPRFAQDWPTASPALPTADSDPVDARGSSVTVFFGTARSARSAAVREKSTNWRR
jgi:hypothetical protein